MNIGIDLGTTYSVVAVKGNVPLAEGYPEGMYLEECGVTVIPTPEGNYTFPSVFWADPDNPENILLGDEAKAKAEEGETPIMFSKRSIGTTEPLRIRGETYTAR
jgi:molecular chaperone DnaK (HSP70)